mmetsp:Transcript_15551/g.23857  ORF Transcript_15551/g.23857 Transcript_15551/m.23857 type:complete len:102 (+) Transcript_15551:1286-1591(+)
MDQLIKHEHAEIFNEDTRSRNKEVQTLINIYANLDVMQKYETSKDLIGAMKDMIKGHLEIAQENNDNEKKGHIITFYRAFDAAFKGCENLILKTPVGAKVD